MRLLVFAAALVAVAVATLPFTVLAQETPIATWHGIDLGPILALLGTLVTALLAWVARKIAASNQASAEKSKAEQAMLRVTALAVALAGRAWDRLSPELQRILADGKISAEERAELEAIVKQLAVELAGEDTLKELAAALGLPLPGLIAKIASMLIDTFTKAHDPGNASVSARAFPVASDEVRVESLG